MEMTQAADVCARWQQQCNFCDDLVDASEGAEGDFSRLLVMQRSASVRRSGARRPHHDRALWHQARRVVYSMELLATLDEYGVFYLGSGGDDCETCRAVTVTNSGLEIEAERDAESEEDDEVGFFQAARPVSHTWEELMELFWQWFEQERQVGMAVGMVRRMVQSRENEEYTTWTVPAVGALAAGIPHSAGIEASLTPPDFFVWATEVESILYAAFHRRLGAGGSDARANVSEVGPDTEDVAFMERGRRGGERQRRQDRSRSCRASEARRRRGERASGSGGPAVGDAPEPHGSAASEAIRGAPWRSKHTTFVPPPPRDNDDCVDRWRFLLGVDTVSLPQGLETTGRDRPFLPPERAEHIRRVISGYTATEQGLMTLGLLTTLRAMLAELGNVLHMASFVEVPVEVPVEEPPPVEHEPEPEAAEEEADSDSTMWLQVTLQVFEVEGISLVQRDVNLLSGLVMRFQDALSGGDLGLARLRAEHFRKRLHQLRLDENVDGAFADQFEAVCVVAEETGSSSVAMGYHALEPQLAEWSWAWWRLIEPALVLQPLDPPCPGDPVEVSSSLDTGRSSGATDRVEPAADSEIAQLASDQEETRRDEMALAAQQALYETEEDQYYKGVEEAVHKEIEVLEAQAAKSWDDWALYDEMHRAPPTKRRRPCLDVVVRQGVKGGQDRERSWRIPFVAGATGSVTLSFGYMDESEGEPASSEASTIAVPGRPHGAPGVGRAEPGASNQSMQAEDGQGDDGAIPMEFTEFQALYDQWARGEVADAMVKARHGASTLDMLQAQHIVVQEGTQVIAARPEPTNLHMVTPNMVTSEALAVSTGGGCAGAVPSGCGNPREADTFLDTLLSTCRSWHTSRNGSYEVDSRSEG